VRAARSISCYTPPSAEPLVACSKGRFGVSDTHRGGVAHVLAEPSHGHAHELLTAGTNGTPFIDRGLENIPPLRGVTALLTNLFRVD